MDNASLYSSVLLVCIAILAFATLITRKRILNTLFLLTESLLIVIYYLFDQNYLIFMTPLAVILCFLCLVILSATLYIEKTSQVSTASTSTLGIFWGAIFFLFFAFVFNSLKNEELQILPEQLSFFGDNLLAIFAISFIILSILISANAILLTKNSD